MVLKCYLHSITRSQRAEQSQEGAMQVTQHANLFMSQSSAALFSSLQDRGINQLPQQPPPGSLPKS